MVKVILFDIGGTYLEGSFVDFMNQSYKVLGIDKTFSIDKEVTFDSDYNRGKISAEECFRKVFDTSISHDQMKDIMDIWTSTWNPTTEMTDFVTKLTGKYTLGVLSNSDIVNTERYRREGIYSPFDMFVLSHEEGFLKPEKEIYDIALERAGCSAEECVFIDDQENVRVPAREMGMKTVQFTSFSQMKEDLAKLGVTVD